MLEVFASSGTVIVRERLGNDPVTSLRRVSWGERVSEAASAAIVCAAVWWCLPPQNFLAGWEGEVDGAGCLKMGWNVGVNVERGMEMRVRRGTKCTKWGLIISNYDANYLII